MFGSDVALVYYLFTIKKKIAKSQVNLNILLMYK